MLKKAIELSAMCGLKMYVMMYDQQKDKIIEYMSSSQFSIQKASEILESSKKVKSKKKFHHLVFTNKDYYSFVTNQQKSLNKEDGVWFGPQSKSESKEDSGNDQSQDSIGKNEKSRKSKSHEDVLKKDVNILKHGNGTPSFTVTD